MLNTVIQLHTAGFRNGTLLKLLEKGNLIPFPFVAYFPSRFLFSGSLFGLFLFFTVMGRKVWQTRQTKTARCPLLSYAWGVRFARVLLRQDITLTSATHNKILPRRRSFWKPTKINYKYPLTLKSDSEAIRSSSSFVALEAWWWWRTAGACTCGGCCCDWAGSTTVSWTVTVTCLVPGRGRVPPWEGGTGDVEARLRTIEKGWLEDIVWY